MRISDWSSDVCSSDLLARERIPPDQVTELQRRLVLSHAVGTGPLLSDAVVRLVLLLKINSLAQGLSGIRWETLAALVAFLNADLLPCVPAQGSVGASGADWKSGGAGKRVYGRV